MLNQEYKWKRFWCPPTGNIRLSEEGYLLDPDEEKWGNIHNPDVVSFGSIATAKCLVLLGEPGIGKTTTARSEFLQVEKKCKEEGNQALWLDLNAYGDESRLVRDLFEGSEFQEWKEGTNNLHIYLDSLDECRIRINNIAQLLINELKGYPFERLFFRIICRTAEWSELLDGGLREIWGKDRVRIFELVQLRQQDVHEAAKGKGIDPEAFLEEISRMEIGPLAAKPVTLNFLLNTYKTKGQLPKSQAALYTKGCQLLCEESNRSRRDSHLMGKYNSGQRMIIAARIAAITIFSNRYAIWTGLDEGTIPEDDVEINRLTQGNEKIEGNVINISQDAVKKALDTGLFTSRGTNRMGWAHQTYAEFLAAYYLTHCEMSLNQMMGLIVHPGDPEKKLVPQLHETAAWLAGMVPEVFREIITIDPMVLLRSDVATADVQDRKALVDQLLRLHDQGVPLHSDWNDYWRYRKLDHPGLANQIRPYICDPTKNDEVRGIAIDIAEVCRLKELQHDLLGIALGKTQPYRVRTGAASALCKIGDEGVKAKLKPLLYLEEEEDPDEELIGYALKSLWPKHLSATGLFGCLTPPRQEKLYGSYKGFLNTDLLSHLQSDDLPVALEWSESLVRKKPSRPMDNLVDGIILLGWQHLEKPGVLEAFSKIVFRRLRVEHEIVKEDKSLYETIEHDDRKRRLLLRELVPMVKDPEEEAICLFPLRGVIALRKDLFWMLEQIKANIPKQTQKTWARVILYVWDRQNVGQTEAIYYAAEDNPIIEEEFSSAFMAVELNSPQADRQRKIYRYSLEEQQPERQNQRPSDTSLDVMIKANLEKCESGEIAVWWHLNRLMINPDGRQRAEVWEYDLKKTHGWKTADNQTRQRIIDTAKEYVREGDPETAEWFGGALQPLRSKCRCCTAVLRLPTVA